MSCPELGGSRLNCGTTSHQQEGEFQIESTAIIFVNACEACVLGIVAPKTSCRYYFRWNLEDEVLRTLGQDCSLLAAGEFAVAPV